MPKKTYKLLRFDGGINNDADARDIADHQFAELQNVAVDEMGKIVVLGDIQTTHKTVAGNIVGEGRGLMAVQTDYEDFGVVPGGASGSVTTSSSNTYFLVQNTAAISILDNTTTTSMTITDLNQVTMYWLNGALRAYEADTTNTNTVVPKWRGFIKGVLYGTDSTATNATYKGHVYNSGGTSIHGAGGAAIDQWYTQSNDIKGCFPTEEVTIAEVGEVDVGINLICSAERKVRMTIDANAQDENGAWGFANEDVHTGTGPGTTVTPAAGDGNASFVASNMYWGHALNYQSYIDSEGSWCPTGKEMYQFYCTTIYDGTTAAQESLPQLFTMYPDGPQAEEQRAAAVVIAGDDDYPRTTANSYYGPLNDDPFDTNCYNLAMPVGSLIFADPEDLDAPGTNLAIWFRPVIKWNGEEYNSTVTTPANVDYNFGASTVSAIDSGNPRITGIRVYWASSEDGYADLWELYEWDFAKGIKAPFSQAGIGAYNLTDWTGSKEATYDDTGLGHHWYQHVHASNPIDVGSTTGLYMKSPPRFRLYKTQNAHFVSESVTIEAAKAVAISNNRVYLGNIKVDGIVYGDRMVRSGYSLDGPTLDKFPFKSNFIDASIGDGDEIVALQEYADRILQFKKNSLYIINASSDAEFAESEHRHKGISNPGAVCRTDYGCAWVNNHGCFLYDGKELTDLLEEDGLRKVNKDAWRIFIGTSNHHRIGFNPNKRQLVVLSGTTNRTAYVYDMVTKSWTFSLEMVVDGNTGSNFINNPDDGKLLIFDESGTIDKWADTPVGDATPAIIISTKDIDFGEPSVRKKLYRIYVTYQGDGSSITENYRTNGGSSDYGFISGFGSPGAVWTRLELKPDVSTEASNIYSCQLRLTGSCATDFMINDITFIYRMKNVK